MTILTRRPLVVAILVAACSGVVSADNWPQWRGPAGTGASAETGLPHGEAVAIGMVMAFRLSVERGLCPAADLDRVIAHLEAVGLPIATDVDQDRLAARMRHDKKDGALVLTRGIGRAFLGA